MVKVVTNAQAAEAPAEEIPAEVPEAPVENTADDEAVSSEETVFSDEDVADLLDEEPPVVDEAEPEPEPEPEAEEPEPEEPPAEEEPEPVEGEPEQPAEESVAEELAAKEPEVEIPEAPEEPQDTRTPEEVAQEVQKARETAHEKLTEQFKMTEEQEEVFATDPGTVLAKMAADLYLDLYDSMMAGIQQQMPTYVATILQQQNAQTRAEQAFFKAWPQLAKPEYRATIDRISDAYRAQNKSAKPEDAIREIGAQAWVALKLPLDELLALTQPKGNGKAAPEPTAVVEHVPAGTGAARGNAPAPRRLNEYEQFAEEFIDDDKL